ncbi:MAG: hypothetical protein ACO1RX_06730 [Candidatus Sericytochromatia bacterium]
MSQFAINPLSSSARTADLRPLKATQPAAIAATAPGSAATQETRDTLQVKPQASGNGTPSYALVEPAVLSTLTSQLAVPGTLERLQAQAGELPPAARQVLEKLLPLLTPPEQTLDTLRYLLESPALSATARQDLEQAAERVSAVLDASQRGDQAAFDAAMQTPLSLSPLAPGLSNALDYLRQAVDFDQQMVRFDLRQNVVGVVNKVYAQAQNLSQSGGDVKDVARLAVNQTKRLEGSKNEALLSKLVSGQVEQTISALRSRFEGYLQIPGYAEALRTALTEAQIPFQSLADLGNPKFLAGLNGSQIQGIQASLQQQLGRLDTSTAPLRTALQATLQEILPETVQLREDFQKFSADMDGYVRESSRALQTYSRELDIALPASFLNQIDRSPAQALEALQTWLHNERAAAQGQPTRLHGLDTLEKFALQLENGIRLADSVARGENIAPQLLENYERFQTFVSAERALFSAYQSARPEQKPHLREAIFQFGAQFAAHSQQPPAVLQEALFQWLGNYLPAEALGEIRGQLDQIRTGFAHYHRGLQQAEDRQIELGDRHRPHRLPPDQGQQAERLGELLRRSSAYFQDLYTRQGEAAFEAALRQELEQVLKTLGTLPPFLGASADKAASAAEQASEHIQKNLAQRPGLADTLRELAFVDPGQQASAQLHKMERAVDQIKDGLLRSLKAHESERKALQQAQQLRSQIQDQLFTFYNDRQQTGANYHQQRLEELDRELAALLQQR